LSSRPEKDFVIRPAGAKTTLDKPWSEFVPWVCFGSSETPIGFICVNHQKPEKDQTDSHVAWPYEKEKRRPIPRNDLLRVASISRLALNVLLSFARRAPKVKRTLRLPGDGQEEIAGA
jgi:hypothetical protein